MNLFKIFNFLMFFFCFFLNAQENPYKIYDCFLFFNEVDILKIRLHELYDKVDHFVLVESTEAFRGTNKTLYFEQHKQEFAPFLDKIIHVKLTESFAKGNPDPWPREAFQRNQILRGLSQCQPQDIIIISDVDEILRAEKFDAIVTQFRKTSAPILGCQCEMYRHFYNRRDPSFWCGPAFTTYAFLKTNSAEYIRQQRGAFGYFPDAGWHFTTMGGFQLMLEKAYSFSHYRECDTPEARNPQLVYEGIQKLQLVEINERFPKHLIDNLDYFKQKNLVDNGSGYK